MVLGALHDPRPLCLQALEFFFALDQIMIHALQAKADIGMIIMICHVLECLLYLGKLCLGILGQCI